jgi:hypothetical protein
MRRYRTIGWIIVAAFVSVGDGLLGVSQARASDLPANVSGASSKTEPGATSPPEAAAIPEVPPAAPGVFSSQKRGAAEFHLAVTGHAFTTRDDVEKYLAYRAAELTMDRHFEWFMFVEHRAKDDKVPVPKPDPKGMRYSFRLEFWRPIWRYQTASDPAKWKTWSPFSGEAFWADGVDPKSVTAFEASADIVLHRGEFQDDNPLAFDASAVSDYLVNQVTPPR